MVMLYNAATAMPVPISSGRVISVQTAKDEANGVQSGTEVHGVCRGDWSLRGGGRSHAFGAVRSAVRA